MSGIEFRMEVNIEQVPLLDHGLEVFDNIHRSSVENDTTLYDDYVAQRKQLIEDLFITIGVQGASKMGKGGLLNGFMELFLNDPFLMAALRRRGIHTLLVRTYPFVQAREVAKLEGGPDGGPLISPDFPRSEYGPWHGRKISKLQRELADEVLPDGETKEEITEKLRREGIAVVRLEEGSTPLGYLQRRGDLVVIRGRDFGQSVLYSDAFNPARRDNLYLYWIKRGEDLLNDEDSNRFRREQHVDGDTKLVITIQSEKRDVRSLPIDLQNAIRAIVKRSQATPELIPQLHSQLQALETELHAKGKILSPDDEGYYKYSDGMIWLKKRKKPRRFKLLSNLRTSGDKTYNVDYLIRNSGIYRKHPEIYPELLPYKDLLLAA